MILTAIRPVWGSFCRSRYPIAPGALFEVDQETAERLIKNGLARPAATYETKVITPEAQEVRPLPANPFRDLFDSDSEPPALATRRDWMRTASDVPESGDSAGVERDSGGGSDSAGSEAPAPSGQADNRGDSKRRMRRRSH